MRTFVDEVIYPDAQVSLPFHLVPVGDMYSLRCLAQRRRRQAAKLERHRKNGVCLMFYPRLAACLIILLS